MSKSKIFPYLEVLFAVIVWGASFIATKIGVKEVSPITVVWLRFGMGVIILGIAVAVRKEFALPSKTEWGYFALLGFLGITWHQWLQSTGLVTAQASTTAWIVATTPIFMALLGWLILKENLTWGQGAGIMLATLGVILVVSNGAVRSIFSSNFGTPGDYLIMISALNWAVFSALSRRGLKKHPAARMMFYVMAFGWIFSSIAFFAGDNLSEVPKLSFNGWVSIAFLGIFCSGLAYIAWYDGLQVIPTSQIGAFLYLEPLVAVIVAGVILAEPITWVSLVGGITILLGVYLVNRPSRK
ncbi:MAG: DMT family transporter [Anaerolineae bacterium]|jgi:drug/metabolite transporter (DMT)-like permease|nr:DMT family transporter [Anaerolineae bacterium]MBT3713843.1 DMT family transporter [Anaerolineae bacterium]MBT4308941.1 DMT family transporter [Anaerolineae bacterium]MBT4457385.1 DMT family transporter [Anaerolineae bacterium]MBT4842927.1 DMT family transporter [Anaerolineae bacterium]